MDKITNNMSLLTIESSLNDNTSNKKNERIKKLKEHLNLASTNHKTNMLKLNTLKDSFVYCIINKLSSQQYGVLLESIIQYKFNFNKNKSNDCIGDYNKNNENFELKVSLGGKYHNKFNFVQIRLNHKCAIYIFIAYHLSVNNVDEEGEIYIFKIPKKEIINLILLYGSYAHGTIKKNGVITIDTLNENNKNEYALRPVINDKCWLNLMDYRISEKDM
jgi:hypothetical protein